MAQRRRDLIYLDRSKTLKLIESSEWGKVQLAATEHRLRPGMTRLETAEWSLDRQWQMAVDAAAKVRMPGVIRGVAGLEVVFLPREEVAAACEAFPDESALVSVSDALSSLVWRLATFNAAWRGGSSLRARFGRRARVRAAAADPDTALQTSGVRAATAALRYTTQHIRVWGTSAAIGLRAEEAGLRDGMLAAAFVHAHEIGHYVLGHDLPSGTAKSPAERELEADEFALRALLGTYGAFDRVAVGAGAIVALTALQVWESAALLRDVRAHPPVPDRWQALAAILGESHLEAEGHTFAARAIAGVTASSGSLPVEYWDALRADNDYEIVHGLKYLLMIQGFDTSESLSTPARDEIIRTLAGASPLFLAGWETLKERGWMAAYDAWGLATDGLLDPNRPLSYWQVVNRIAAAPVWGDTSDVFRRTCALLSIHARPAELKRVC
jgi:hypothetical protein